MVQILAIIGTSGSGKTTLIEYVVSKLSNEGLRIGTIKHVHHPGFTIDSKGKDTWRHSKAGAKVVVSVAPEEIAIIRKRGSSSKEDLERILDIVKDEKLDLIILEGFHSLISKRESIPKIVTANNEDDLRRTMEGTSEPILAITGPIAERKTPHVSVTTPIISLNEEGEKILRLIKDAIQT